MMKRQKRKGIEILAVLLCIFFMTARCAGQKTGGQERQDEEIKVPIILIVDSSTGNKNEQELVEAFNKEYEGVYQVDAKWIMETEEEYRRNLKRQNVTDELPAVITDLRMLPSFYERIYFFHSHIPA